MTASSGRSRGTPFTTSRRTRSSSSRTRSTTSPWSTRRTWTTNRNAPIITTCVWRFVTPSLTLSPRGPRDPATRPAQWGSRVCRSPSTATTTPPRATSTWARATTGRRTSPPAPRALCTAWRRASEERSEVGEMRLPARRTGVAEKQDVSVPNLCSYHYHRFTASKCFSGSLQYLVWPKDNPAPHESDRLCSHTVCCTWTSTQNAEVDLHVCRSGLWLKILKTVSLTKVYKWKKEKKKKMFIWG